jgi:LPS-assembly protein
VRVVATVIAATNIIAATAVAQAPVTDSSVRGISCWSTIESLPVATDLGDAIEMTTGDADIEADGDATFKGPVTMRSRDLLLQAAQASYDAESATFLADGGVEFRSADSTVSGESVSYNTREGLFNFKAGSFVIPQTPARGSADAVEISRDGYLQLDNVRYTSCPEGNNDWLLKARSIHIDANKGMGTARNATLRFKNVPILYLPYFTYPVTDERKSGLLFPTFSNSTQRGAEVEAPVYWNIRPNMDATIIPRYMSSRGVQLGTEYRFLAKQHEGTLWGDYLANDEQTDTDRWRYDVETESFLPWDWRSRINASGVSDDNYFEDMSSNLQDTSLTNLNRSIDFERYSEHWSLFGRFQGFQTIDEAITPDEEPYAQLPQLVADGIWRDGLLGLNYTLETEAVYFYRTESTNGARVHARPGIALPIEGRGYYLTPAVDLDYTAYLLTDQAADLPDDPSRTAPIASVDAGAVFDRLAGKRNQLLVTLEPRVLYTYIPFREQNDLPVFDTIRPDFNLVQLFRRNQFVGYDRLADENQLSTGLTSRVLSSADGRELLALTLGQTRYFETSEVTLPDEQPFGVGSSNYIAELDIRTWKRWNAGLQLQWDSEQKETDRSAVRLQYKPDDFRAINLAYRYVRDSLEQTDISFAWPLAKKITAIGRFNYSLLEEKSLDRYAGLEYESCCWAIRLLGRRSVSRSTGESDTTVSFQFELKGFSNVGSSSISSLERGILDTGNR